MKTEYNIHTLYRSEKGGVNNLQVSIVYKGLVPIKTFTSFAGKAIYKANNLVYKLTK